MSITNTNNILYVVLKSSILLVTAYLFTLSVRRSTLDVSGKLVNSRHPLDWNGDFNIHVYVWSKIEIWTIPKIDRGIWKMEEQVYDNRKKHREKNRVIPDPSML